MHENLWAYAFAADPFKGCSLGRERKGEGEKERKREIEKRNERKRNERERGREIVSGSRKLILYCFGTFGKALGRLWRGSCILF